MNDAIFLDTLAHLASTGHVPPLHEALEALHAGTLWYVDAASHEAYVCVAESGEDAIHDGEDHYGVTADSRWCASAITAIREVQAMVGGLTVTLEVDRDTGGVTLRTGDPDAGETEAIAAWVREILYLPSLEPTAQEPTVTGELWLYEPPALRDAATRAADAALDTAVAAFVADTTA